MPVPIRLLYFLNSPGVPGGVEGHVYGLMAHLPQPEFDVSLVCPHSMHAMFAPLQGPQRRIFPLDLFRLTHLRSMKKLSEVLTDRKPQIAHSHQFIATFFLAPIAKARRVPTIIETTHVREAWRRSWLKRSYIIDRLIYTLVDRFVAVSHANQRYLVDQKRCPPAKIVQIYNGRQLDSFRSDGHAGATTRRTYGIAPDDCLVVHVGRLTVQKGHAFLLEAVPEIKRRVPHLKVMFVGDGELRRTLEDDVRRRGLEATVIFTGFQPSAAAFLHAADLVVLPSLFEGLPLVAIEAAAAGKPIVATEVDGTPEVVQNDRTGLLIPPRDPRSLTEAIVSLLSDASRRRQMGVAARRFAEERFSLAEHVARHAELYRSLAE